MGFYGNITNSSTTQFTFDKIYPNRVAMDSGAKSDGVFIGRYVLIEYDNESANDVNIQLAYRNDNEPNYFETSDIKYLKGKTYYTISDNGVNKKTGYNIGDLISENLYEKNLSSEYLYKIPIYYDSNKLRISNDFPIDTIVKVDESNGAGNGPYTYYQCDGKDENGYATFKLVYGNYSISNDVSVNAALSYTNNYYIDINTYGQGRGYDSTVWQKVYRTDGEDVKYVMIAELNSVVPTFDITSDAPSIVPIPPYFDSNNTNLYYKMHAQANWGIRTKAADKDLTGPVLNSLGIEIDNSAPINLTSDTNDYPSDVNVVWERDDFSNNNHYYYDSEDGKWKKNNNPYTLDQAKVPAAIYWNNDGFKKNKITYSKDISNKPPEGDMIKLAPTGFSGMSYEITDGSAIGATKPQKDMLELSIMLPSVGDSIAEMWDIVYGGKDTSIGIENTGVRNTDIQWENGEGAARNGLRLSPALYEKITLNNVSYEKNKYYKIDLDGNYILSTGNYDENTQYYKLEEGLNYTPDQVNTLAGCINSVHDLMGMIVIAQSKDINPDDINCDDYESNKIYYFPYDNTYRCKISNYEYEEIAYVYETVNITENNYIPNYYYYKANEEYKIASGTFDLNKRYYAKKSDNNINKEYELINLTDYLAGYYSKTPEGHFIYDEGLGVQTEADYYKLELTNDELDEYGVTASNTYEPNKFYLTNDNKKSFSTDGSSEPDSVKTYYEFTEDTDDEHILNVLTNDEYSDTENYDNTGLQYLFVENVFFEKYVDDDEKTKYKSVEEYDDSIEEYYLIDRESGAISDVFEGAQYINAVKNPIKVKLIPFDENNNNYYYIEKNDTSEIKTYNKITKKWLKFQYNGLGQRINGGVNIQRADEDTTEIVCGTFNEITDQFYTPNKYYYRENNSFIIDKSSENTIGRTYYKISEIEDKFNLLEEKFYIPNKYYYKEDIQYILDKNLERTDNREYYDKNNFYILGDLNNIFTTHGIWNKNLDIIPASISLSKLKKDEDTKHFKMKKLKGFARTLNTLHGLIIRINNLLLEGDYDTRDRGTVQGCINVLNDLINNFGKLGPQTLLTTDIYGRITSSEINTEENSGIDININSDLLNPGISIKHKKQELTNGETIETSANGNKLSIPKITVDNMGHITAINNNEITLEEKYTTFKDGDNKKISDSTILLKDDDYLTFSVDAVNKGIKINHKEKTVNPSSETKVLSFGEDFEIQKFEFDDAGHRNTLTNSTLTLPNISINKTGEITNQNKILTDITIENNVLQFKYDNAVDLLLTEYSKFYLENGDPKYYTGAVDSDDTINSAFAKVSNDIVTLVNTDIGKSVRTIANEELVAQLIATNPKESLDTLQEIAAWIQQHPDDAAAMNTAITNLQTSVSAAETDIDNLQAVAMPDHSTLTEDSVYMIQKTATGIEWVEISSWTGGAY